MARQARTDSTLSRWLMLALLAGVAWGTGCSSGDRAAGDTLEDMEAEVARPLRPEGCEALEIVVPEGCSGCHGAPPSIPTHPANPACWRCHGHVVDEDFGFLPTELHKNGATDVMVGCSSCHGWRFGVSPPQGLDGGCDYGSPGIGAHAAMRRNGVMVHQVGCNNCHVVPLTTWADGHIDGDGVAEVSFRWLATADGAQPAWNGDTCSSVYCHGATLTGGFLTEPGWFDTTGDARRCGACHRITDPEGDEGADCHACHPTTVDEVGGVIYDGAHLNGVIDLPNE